MKFITENDLRALYKAQPFSSYDPKEGERLTPGARQFLIDRGINMYGGRNLRRVLHDQQSLLKQHPSMKKAGSS